KGWCGVNVQICESTGATTASRNEGSIRAPPNQCVWRPQPSPGTGGRQRVFEQGRGRMKMGRTAGIALAAWALPISLMCDAGLAQADELADLRANQELLQRRVDQLAQAGPSVGPGPGGPVMTGSLPR